jgi:hypothetical protein
MKPGIVSQFLQILQQACICTLRLIAGLAIQLAINTSGGSDLIFFGREAAQRIIMTTDGHTILNVGRSLLLEFRKSDPLYILDKRHFPQAPMVDYAS